MAVTDDILGDWSSRGFTGGVQEDAPGQAWQDCVHREDELVLVLDGKVAVDVGGEELRPSPGEEVVIPRGVVHSIRNVGSTTATWLYGYRE